MTKKYLFGKGFYRLNRKLHLYFGLFLCPFLILFAVSTIMMNHGITGELAETSMTVPLAIPETIQDNLALAKQKFAEAKLAADGDEKKKITQEANKAANSAASELTEHTLATLGLSGELFAFKPMRNNQKEITVMVPGRTTIVTIDVVKQEAVILERSRNLLDTMRYLHRNPGPHKVKGPNWIGSKAWGWVADTTVYLTLFLTVSGIYLWYAIKAERKIGLIFLGSGCVSFVAILFALLIA